MQVLQRPRVAEEVSEFLSEGLRHLFGAVLVLHRVPRQVQVVDSVGLRMQHLKHRHQVCLGQAVRCDVEVLERLYNGQELADVYQVTPRQADPLQHQLLQPVHHLAVLG